MASRFSIVTLNLLGTAQFKRTFKRMRKEVRKGIVRKAAQRGGQVLLMEIKSRAPVRKRGGERDRGKKKASPGFLKRSISMRIRARESEAQARVGPSKDAFYGLFVEFGTKHASAHPFMRPAFDSKKVKAADRSILVFQKFLERFSRARGVAVSG